MKKIRFLVAYPGSGKSTLASHLGDRVIDADFGTYRKKLTGKHFWELDDKEKELVTLSYLETYLSQIEDSRSDVIVMTNDLLPVDYLLRLVRDGVIDHHDLEVCFTYPGVDFESEWLKTLEARGCDVDFINALKANTAEWKLSWLSIIDDLRTVASCLKVSCRFAFLNSWLSPLTLNELFPRCAS